MRTTRLVFTAGLLALGAGACNFDITNTNQPTLDDLLTNPTRTKLSAAATGLFAGARGGIQALIWRLGSMGREGINLSGNNQPDFIEPYFGPVVSGGSFGGTLWLDRYQHIRSANVYLDALARVDTVQVHTLEKAASRGMANTLKALAFMYVIETRAQLGAPIDVGGPVTAAPAPFVREDSVYKYIIGLLDSARSDLARAAADPTVAFPFPVPPGFAAFAKPGTFLQFNRALAAKANVLRATDATGCAGSKATCYGAALTALAASFMPSAASFQDGAYFDFSPAPGDASNNMSEPLNALTFFALQDNIAQADTQTNGKKDQRVLDKIVPAVDTQIALLGAIPIPGQLKFTVFMDCSQPGAVGCQADEAHPIAIIRNEELVLLDAEAQWFAGSKAQAIIDLNNVRTGAGKLPATTVTAVATDSAFLDALQYERRFSLLWEQGTRWIDARRFGRLARIPLDVPLGKVPPVMPVPQGECDARGLTASEVIPDVVTCQP
jgi:starch-binding outer membrane protein, SusD/RagB family